jgi:AAA domain
MNATAYDRLVDVLENVKHPSGNPDKARANCPAHDSASRSSLSIKRTEGKALIYCFGGCTPDQILDALGWSKADLYDDRKGYVYSYPDGVYAHRSYNGDGKKKFHQSGNLGGDSTKLYRLSSIETAKLAGQAVWLVEGEDDVHAMETLGVIATTTRGGVGMMGKADLSPLYDAYVCAVVDKDEAGAKWAQYMRTMLEGKARGLAFLQALTGKDAQDHVAADHGLSDFQPYKFPDPEPEEERLARRIRLTPASSIKPRPVRWAWTDRIPAGELTLTPGRGGVGKSTFHAWAIANLTRGTLPGVHFGTPKPCIIAASEDSWERTIAPRLIAAGADMDLVYRVDAITETDEVVSISLPLDIDGLTEEIVRTGAALLSVDPVMSVLSAALDSHKDQEVRRGLEPLGRLADQTGCVVLGNAHFNKSAGSDPLALIMGSAAFGNVARAALGFARDTEAEDGSCVISQAKNNLGRLDLPSLRYRIDNETIDTDEGPADVGKLVMLGESDRSVADILRDRGSNDDHDERNEIDQWLVDYLNAGSGQAHAGDVITAAKRAGFSENAVKKARIRIKAKSERSGFGKDAFYTWVLMDSMDSQFQKPGTHGTHGESMTEPSDVEDDDDDDADSQSAQSAHSSQIKPPEADPTGPSLRPLGSPCSVCSRPLMAPHSLQRGICESCWLANPNDEEERTSA